MIAELRDLSYEKRLRECGLTTLETRKLRGDKIKVFKILNGNENENIEELQTERQGTQSNVSEGSDKTINECNKLSIDCVNASSSNMIKNKIYKYLRTAG